MKTRMTLLRTSVLLVLAIGITMVQSQEVSTFAGDGLADGPFNEPNGIVVDANGNSYVTDTKNHRIQKISPTGVVTNFAGSGTAGYADGNGTAATFNEPIGIALHGTDLYVADTKNNLIRKITSAGDVSIFAGTSGDFGFGSTDGIGTAAKFWVPTGIAVHGDTLYVADQINHRIRKIVIATATVTTLAGSSNGYADGVGTEAQFKLPSGLAVFDDTLYVTDQSDNRIRKIVIATAAVSTLAGGGTFGSTDGTGTLASFGGPEGIVADDQGNLYVGDTWNNRIRKITPSGVVTTLAGGWYGYLDGIGTAAKFTNPTGMGIDASGNLYVADKGNNRIRMITMCPNEAPTVADQSFCGSATIADLEATTAIGETVEWFAESTGGMALATTDALATATDYYAAAKITATGCVGTTRSKATVTLNSLPVAPTASATQEFCYGATVSDLDEGTVINDVTVSWYSAATGGTLLEATATLSTTDYYAAATNTITNCASANRTAVTVTINLPPSSISVQDVQTLNSGATIADLTIFEPAGEEAVWYSEATGGTPLASTTVLTATDYYVTLKNSTTNCERIDRLQVTVIINATGINENSFGTNITLYPNPVEYKLTIDSKDYKVQDITILDVTGKVITTIKTPTKVVDVSNLTKGLYFLQLQTEEGVGVKGFIKK